MKVISVVFGRWKGAKITTEHSMHVLRAYRVSLTSLRPNQVSCLTSGNRFGMFFLYLQFTFEWINIFYSKSYMYRSHSLHNFSNYIVNMVVCICWIIVDCVGAVQKLFAFTACILYSRATHMEVYRAAHTFLGGWRLSSRTCSPTVWDEARHTGRC